MTAAGNSKGRAGYFDIVAHDRLRGSELEIPNTEPLVVVSKVPPTITIFPVPIGSLTLRTGHGSLQFEFHAIATVMVPV